MPNSWQSSDIDSPASRRATNCNRSSMTEHSFQGISPSSKKAKECNPCVRYEMSPMSQVAHNKTEAFRDATGERYASARPRGHLVDHLPHQCWSCWHAQRYARAKICPRCQRAHQTHIFSLMVNIFVASSKARCKTSSCLV